MYFALPRNPGLKTWQGLLNALPTHLTCITGTLDYQGKRNVAQVRICYSHSPLTPSGPYLLNSEDRLAQMDFVAKRQPAQAIEVDVIGHKWKKEDFHYFSRVIAYYLTQGYRGTLRYAQHPPQSGPGIVCTLDTTPANWRIHFSAPGHREDEPGETIQGLESPIAACRIRNLAQLRI